MKLKLSYWAIIIKLLCCTCLFSALISCVVIQGKTLSNQNKKGKNLGYDLTVSLDGHKSLAAGNADLNSLGFISKSTASQFWAIPQLISSAPKIKYDIDEEYIGRFKEAKLLIEKVPQGKSKIMLPYYCNLSDANADFEPGYQIQIENFRDSEQDKYFPELPAGKYIFTLYVYGQKSWDKQDILVNIG